VDCYFQTAKDKHIESLLVMRERKRTYGSMFVLSVAAVLIITGCSSGGDGGESNKNFATTEGTAAKGIIRNGVITAFELDSNGTLVRNLGTTTTNNEGKYSLPVGGNYTRGPVLLKVTASEDGKTIMVCDVSSGCGAGVDFGDTFSLENTFEMTTILPSLQEDASVDAHITPFTHMAARRAMRGEINDDNINKAISEVNKVVGVDIQETAPIDITKTTPTSSPEALVYSAFLAAAGQLVVSDSGGLSKGLEKLAGTFEDGKFDTNDDFTITDLISAVEVEVDANAGIDTTELRDQIFLIEVQTENGNFDPESSDTVSRPPLEQAKALVSDARTWIDSIVELETPMEAFAIDIDEAAKVLDANSVALTEMAADVITSVAEKLESEHNTNGTLELVTYPVDVMDSQGQTVGEVDAVLSDNNGDGLKFAIKKKSGLNGVELDLVVTTNIPEKALSGGVFDLESAKLFVSGSVANDQASIKLNELRLNVSFETEVNVDPEGDAPEVDISSASMYGEITLIANGVTFKGNAGLSFVALNKAAPSSNNTVSLRKAEINGKFTSSNGKSFSAAAKLTINNAASFDTFAFFDHEPTLWVQKFEPGDLFDAELWAREQNSSLTTIDSVSFESFQNETCYGGQIAINDWFWNCVPGDLLDAESKVYENVKDQYPTAKDVSNVRINYSPNSTSYWASVNFGDFETAANYANATFSVSVNLALQGYPDTRAVITAERNSLEGGDIRMSLVRKGLILTFIASISETDPITGTLTVSNADGAKMVLSASDGVLEGILSVQGTKVGTVEQTNDGLLLVRYKDGNFETLQ
jgi:hypothetical protein